MTDLSRWPALVLTAGLATRLRPLSTVRAKAALPVAGEALVLRILRWLRAAGVTRVVLNLHHRAESITRIVGDGSALGLSVRYSWESSLLGSAGGPARALPLLEADRFLIVNGDTLADVNLNAMAAHHLDTNAQVTMAVVKGDPRYNGVVSAHGIVTGFSSRSLAPSTLAPSTQAPSTLAPSTLAPATVSHFIGIQAVNASAFAGVNPDAPSETVTALYPALIERQPGSVRVFRTAAEFFDIGTPADYLETVATLAARERTPLDRGRDCDVAAGARLERTILWDRVTIETGVSLSNCIVTDGARVPAGAHYDRCSIVMTERGMIAEPWNLA
ncbi:MAG: NDP-sugar synthase [Vicinamibacterales bacterium]